MGRRARYYETARDKRRNAAIGLTCMLFDPKVPETVRRDALLLIKWLSDQEAQADLQKPTPVT